MRQAGRQAGRQVSQRASKAKQSRAEGRKTAGLPMSATGFGVAPSSNCSASSAVPIVARRVIHGAASQRQVIVLKAVASSSICASAVVRQGHQHQQPRPQLQPRLFSSPGPGLSQENRKLARCVTPGPAHQLSPNLSGESKDPVLEDEKLGALDEFLLKKFREQMAEEVGWESQKAGFDGLLEVVNHLFVKSSKPEVEKAVVRVFTALFPKFVITAFRNVILPVADGKPAAILMAYVTQATTRWLMGPSIVNQVTLADGSTLLSGVLVERCKFLEGSECAGICTHICKIPTQAFIKDVMSVDVAIEPNFEDFSCQFNFGVEALPRDQDPGLQTPCLSICPTAAARATLRNHVQTDQCPQVYMEGVLKIQRRTLSANGT